MPITKQLSLDGSNILELRLKNVKTTRDILGDQLEHLYISNTYKEHLAVDPSHEFYHYSMQLLKDMKIFNLQIILSPYMLQSVKEPDNIFKALAKLGGLLGLAKIFILISFAHEVKFEQRLSKEKEKADDLEERGGKDENRSFLLQKFEIQDETTITFNTNNEIKPKSKVMEIREFFSFDTIRNLHKRVRTIEAKIS